MDVAVGHVRVVLAMRTVLINPGGDRGLDPRLGAGADTGYPPFPNDIRCLLHVNDALTQCR